MPTLSISITYADGDTLFKADLDDIKSGIQDFLNVTKIDADNIQTGSITATCIATGAVTAAKIGTSAVETAKIADDAVTAAKLADDASVDANRAVTTNHIRDLAVTTAKINDLAVTTGKINDLAVTTGKINDAAVTAAKLAAAVAGDGLAGGAGSALSVNVDSSTIEISSDSLQVKAAGITESHLATSVAGSGLAGGGGTALSVNVDSSTIEINTDTLRVKDSGISLAKLAAAVSAALVPSGTILAYGGTSAPTGYLMCDGSTVSRNTYATLFSAIGIAFGSGDNVSTFHLPDLRGRFLRGVDGAQGRDPDRASRTAMNSGGNTGDNVGSIQGHAFQTHNHTDSGHTHTQYKAIFAGGATAAAFTPADLGGGTDTLGSSTANIQNATASGTHAQASSNETRPVNANANFIIKT